MKLLHVDNSVSMHDLLDQTACLHIVHGPDVLNPGVVALFKPLILELEVLEQRSKLLVLLSELLVYNLVAFLGDEEILALLALLLLLHLLLLLKGCFGLGVDV